MTEPLVTVVVAAFRRTDYLPAALASALAQTWDDFEVIVADDGPTPEIAAIAASFRDPRIRYRANPRNLGIALNHRAAFAEARGRFIANLDDDDVWEPGFLARLVPPMLEDATITTAFCDHHLIDAGGRVLPEATDRNSRLFGRDRLAPGRHQPFLDLAVARESLPMAMAAVFRRDNLDGAPYSPRVGGCYDQWLAYLAARGGGAAFYVPERLTRYRLHAGSGSATRGLHNLRDAVYVRSRFLRDPTVAGAPFAGQVRESLGVHYGKMALLLFARGKRRAGWTVWRRALGLIRRPRARLGLLANTARQFLRGG
jgi:glycosyltransferase involved in cell wall biosynthesis